MSKNAEGWVRHRGGKCPVEAGVLVDVRYRDGDIHHSIEALASPGAEKDNWIHETDKESSAAYCDIMAYRLHKPAEQPKPFIEAVQAFNALAKFPQLDGPTGWRDRIAEIDATTQALTTERAELVQKLAGEGFALIRREPDVPIGLPREEWEIGDLVVLPEKTAKTSMPTGVPLPITFFDGSSDGQDVKVDDFYYPPVCDLIWHSRPSA